MVTFAEAQIRTKNVVTQNSPITVAIKNAADSGKFSVDIPEPTDEEYRTFKDEGYTITSNSFLEIWSVSW